MESFQKWEVGYPFLISDFPHFARCVKAGENCAAPDRPIELIRNPLDRPEEKRETIPNPTPQPTTIRLRLRWRLGADVHQ
jgi:hypothetical protein